MKYNENLFDFAEFDKMLNAIDTFENCIRIEKTVDNSTRKPMNKKQFANLQNNN